MLRSYFYGALVLLSLSCGNAWNTQDLLDAKFRDGDTTPPSVAVTSHTSGASFGSGSFAIQGSASDNVDILKLEYSVNGSAFAEAMGRTTWLFYLNTAGFADGAYALKVRAYDTSKNFTTIDFAFSVDNSAPAAVLSTTPALVTNSKNSSITVGGAGIVEYQFMIDNTYYSSARPVSQAITFTNYFLDGSHTISVIGKNSLGTWQSTASATVYTWTVDTLPPTATMTLGTFNVNTPTTFNYTIAGTGVVNYKYSTNGGSTWSSAISTSIILSIDTSVTNLSQLKVVGIDAATNEQAAASATTPTATAPVLLAALSMDVNQDGFMDHYKLIFNQPVNDSTFPGFAGNNNLGTVTANWLVAGYSNVRLDTRDALPPNGPGDTGTNDNILYLMFDQKTGVNFDTNSTPDLTTSGASIQNMSGLTMANLTSGALQELDRILPFIYRISIVGASDVLEVELSEPIYTDTAHTSTIMPISAFAYLNNATGGATAITGYAATSGSNDSNDGILQLQLDAAPVTSDGDGAAPDDVLKLVGGNYYDFAGNTGDVTNTYIVTPGIIYDVSTNLTWMRCSYGQTWSAATNTCTGTAGVRTWCYPTTCPCWDSVTLELAYPDPTPGCVATPRYTQVMDYCRTLTFAGRTWRVPTPSELLSIHSAQALPPHIDETKFPNTFSGQYYANRKYNFNSAYSVDFSSSTHATNSYSMQSSTAVRCVSSGL